MEDPETVEIDKISTEEARLGYILTWLDRIERSIPQGRVGLEPAHRNITSLRNQVNTWFGELRALELRLKVPED